MGKKFSISNALTFMSASMACLMCTIVWYLFMIVYIPLLCITLLNKDAWNAFIWATMIPLSRVCKKLGIDVPGLDNFDE